MKTLWKLILLAWALLYMLTACARPGFAVTYSGIYRATDGQEFSASATYRPIHAVK
jgi:hypothetical protein